MNGYCAAALAVLIWASYPVATRAALTGSFTPETLVLLRFGVGALLFTPYLLLRWRAIARATWVHGVPLTLTHGAGMAALAIAGMQLAPANHAAALGPGASPAWVALLGFLLFAQRASRRAIAGAVLCLIRFLGASALAALYVLQLRRWGVDALQGAAIVSLYSALVVVPFYLWGGGPKFDEVSGADLLWQVLWQGVLIGCVAVIALNQAIARLGAERASALVAFVPVLTAGLAFAFLSEVPSAMEIAAFVLISAGVSVAAAPRVMPAARLLATPPQNAPRVG